MARLLRTVRGDSGAITGAHAHARGRPAAPRSRPPSGRTVLRQVERISTNDAYQFPLVASAGLFSLFIVFTFFKKCLRAQCLPSAASPQHAQPPPPPLFFRDFARWRTAAGTSQCC